MMDTTTPSERSAAQLSRALHRIRRRWFTLQLLKVMARVLVFAALAIAAAALVERWLQPADSPLLALAALTILLTLAAVAILGWPLRRRPDDRQVARFVEECCPDLDDAVATAIAVRHAPSESAFAPLVVEAAASRLRELDLSRVVDGHELRAVMVRAGAAAVAVGLAAVLAGPFAERVAQVTYLRLFPSSVRVNVRSGDMRVPVGRPVTLTASVEGTRGTLTRVAPVVTISGPQGQTTTTQMTRAEDGYALHIKALERSFKYTVTAGPAVSRAYAVTALYPPRVQRIEVHYDYPSFTGLKPREERDGGDVYGPAGTRVRLIVHTDKPVTTGTLAFSEGKPALPLARVDDRTLASTLTVKEEAAYRVGLVDADGLSSDGIEYFVRVMDDRPPDVHILRPSGDSQITPLEEVPIEARADDDFGIASFDMVYSVGGGPEKVVPFTSLGGTSLARIGSRMLAAEDLHVRPGDVIAYYARARDVPRAKQSTLARSEIFFLEVKPFNEEYVMAQSQSMAGGAANQIEGMISAQKEIISATWNLERRASAGRSPSDIKDVADAQAELKVRAEQAAGTQRQRRRFGQQEPQNPPQQIVRAQFGAQPSPAPATDPVADAVNAMARALQQLQTMKTADAIPHEMAALNALLQAQAEVRRRQLSQQNGNGGGNGNRQGQDLSNLFDRELKRQQKTNYESKAQVETTPDAQKEDSALDKIRDLARRQEELNKRQRDLADAGLSAEEMKRQLEKLTREQEELRKQTEELTRQMKPQQSSQGSPGAQGAQGSSSTQAMRDAQEQMRSAASQSQKEDAAGAAAKGEEAARQLRKAEAQMQNGSPDARRRALGDLQLESQQLAEAQRRIANEAEQLDREGGGATDARRRLAGEKEKLADRVDALQQAAQRLGAEEKADAKARAGNPAAAADAARDLAAQRLGQRMRSGAQGLRDAKKDKLAPGEQQIAEALDKVARKMNGADAGGAKGDTQQLADQLDEVRDARERLARLDKQMKDAQQQAAQGGRGQEAARGQEAGRGQSPGRAGRSGPEGQRGQNGSQGDGQGSDIARLQQEYNKELQRTRDLMDRLQRGNPESGGRMTTPEEHEWSRSAPGTEAFKQDYAAWQSLSGDVGRALERAEASVANRLSSALVKDRLRAGGSERIPDAYRQRVSKYFESIATRNAVIRKP